MIQLYIYIHSFFFHILFHYGLSQDTKYSSLCYTVGPCCLSILYIKAYIFEPQPPTPSLERFLWRPPWCPGTPCPEGGTPREVGVFFLLTQPPCPPGWWMTAVSWSPRLGTWTTLPRSSEVRPLLPPLTPLPLLAAESWTSDRTYST